VLNTPRSFGIPGVSLRTGDHICALVFGQQQQRDSVLLPYVREGLRIGDKCTVAIDELDTADFFAKLAQGSAIDSVPSLGHVDVQTATHSKLNRGRFSLDESTAGLEANGR
jgi:hypothetical protein